MSIQLKPTKRLVTKQGKGDVVTVEGDLVITGTLTAPGFADPEITSSAADFEVGEDLSVVQDAEIGRDLAVTRNAVFGGAVEVEAASPILTVKDTTADHEAVVRPTNSLVQMGAKSDSDLEILVNDLAVLTLDTDGNATFGADVEAVNLVLTGTLDVGDESTFAADMLLEGASSPKLTISDTTTPVTMIAQCDNSVAKVGPTTNHSLQLLQNNVAALILAASGVMTKAGPNSSGLNIKYATASKTCDSGTGTETITGLIPAKARVLGLSARVTTVLAGTSLTTWKLGDSGDDDRYGATLAKDAGTTVTQANATADPAGTWSASARDIVLTAAAGQFDSGVVEVVVWYTDSTAPTS